MKFKRLIIALLFLIFVIPEIFAYSDLTKYIVIVKPELTTEAVSTFKKVADYFNIKEEKALHTIFQNLALQPQCSGFIVTDNSGENYIITSAYLVRYAESVTVELKKKMEWYPLSRIVH